MESVTVIHDESQLRQQHRRYIAYNLGVWLLVVLVGALALVVARQYGNSLTARHQAGLDVQVGAALFAEGNSFQAERVWLQSVDAWPGAVNVLVADQHRALMGMPLLMGAIHELQDARPDLLSPLSALKLHLLEAGHIEAPKALLDEYSLNTGERRTAALWLGRLAFGQGDLSSARTLFEIAWNDNDTQREALLAEIATSHGADSLQHLEALIRNGLWAEAGAMLNSGDADETTPTAHALTLVGLLLEIDGELEAARTAYDAALDKLPNHRLAQQGLRRLQ